MACHGDHLHRSASPGQPPCLCSWRWGWCAGPLPYKAGGHPGGLSCSWVSPGLPRHMETLCPPWRLCRPVPCCSHCPGRRGPHAKATASSLRAGGWWRWRQKRCGSLLPNWARLPFQARVAPGEASRCAAGRHQVGPERRWWAGGAACQGHGLRLCPAGPGRATAAPRGSLVLSGLWAASGRETLPRRRAGGSCVCLCAGGTVPRSSSAARHGVGSRTPSASVGKHRPLFSLGFWRAASASRCVAPGTCSTGDRVTTLAPAPSDYSYLVIYRAL